MKKFLSDIIFLIMSAMVIILAMLDAKNFELNLIYYTIPLLIILAFMTFYKKK